MKKFQVVSIGSHYIWMGSLGKWHIVLVSPHCSCFYTRTCALKLVGEFFLSCFMIKIPGPYLSMEVFAVLRRGLCHSRHGVWFSSGHWIFKVRGSTLTLRARYCSRSVLDISLPLAAMKGPVHMSLTVSPWAFPRGRTFHCCGCGAPRVPCVLFHLLPLSSGRLGRHTLGLLTYFAVLPASFHL